MSVLFFAKKMWKCCPLALVSCNKSWNRKTFWSVQTEEKNSKLPLLLFQASCFCCHSAASSGAATFHVALFSVLNISWLNFTSWQLQLWVSGWSNHTPSYFQFPMQTLGPQPTSCAGGRGGGVHPRINRQLTVSLPTGVAGSSSRLTVMAANIFMWSS